MEGVAGRGGRGAQQGAERETLARGTGACGVRGGGVRGTRDTGARDVVVGACFARVHARLRRRARANGRVFSHVRAQRANDPLCCGARGDNRGSSLVADLFACCGPHAALARATSKQTARLQRFPGPLLRLIAAYCGCCGFSGPHNSLQGPRVRRVPGLGRAAAPRCCRESGRDGRLG